jgi:hypothetical protein
MNRSERRKKRKKDFGEFSVPSDPAREDRFIQHLLSQAALPQNRGTFAGQVEAKMPGPDGRVRVGVRTLEVDLAANTLVVTESWDGREAARRTFKLDALGSQQKPGIFAPRPRKPGPVGPIRRGPDGMATHDPSAVQAAILQRAETEITSTGALAERLVLVCDHHLEELDLAAMRAANPRGGALPTLAALAGRPGVNVRLLTGQHRAPDGECTAFVLGILDGDPEGRFWLAQRQFRVLGGRIGSRGPWNVSDGIAWGGDWHELPRHLAVPRQPWTWGAAVPVPMPTVHCAFRTLPASAELPRTAEQMAAAAAALKEHEAWTQGLDGLQVFLFRGREVEHFVIRGEIPFGTDDLCRALAARGEPPDGLCTMEIGTFHDRELDEILRAVITTGETDGKRYKRILAMNWNPGARPDDPCAQMRYWGSVPEDVAGKGWIGVAPVTELDLFPLGAGDA